MEQKLMTSQEVKAYLSKIRWYDVQINNQLEDLARIEDLSVRVTMAYTGDVVVRTGHSDKVGDAGSKIADIKKDLSRKIEDYKQCRQEICDVIEQVSSPDELDVLQKVYQLHKPWEQIAFEMGMCTRNAQNIHGKALRTVAAIIAQNGRGCEQ